MAAITSCEGCRHYDEGELRCWGMGNYHFAYADQPQQISYVVSSVKLCGPNRKWYKKKAQKQASGYGAGFIGTDDIDTTSVAEAWDLKT